MTSAPAVPETLRPHPPIAGVVYSAPAFAQYASAKHPVHPHSACAPKTFTFPEIVPMGVSQLPVSVIALASTPALHCTMPPGPTPPPFARPFLDGALTLPEGAGCVPRYVLPPAGPVVSTPRLTFA